MPTRWSFEARVPAPPDAVYAWLSEYAEDDHSNERFRRGSGATDDKRSHRVVERKDERRLVVRDEWGRQRFEMQVELAPEAREVRLTGQMGYRAVWRATPDGEETRVTSEGRLEPKGLMRLFAPMFAGAFMKQMKADFEGHVTDLRESLAGGK